MTRFEVELGARSYPVEVGCDDGPDAVAARIDALAPTGVAIVTDRDVARHQPDLLRAAAAGAKGEPTVLAPGEATKTLATVEQLCRAFLDASLDRDGLVVAVGGGVPGDVAGFAAAVYLRGVRVLHAPTSLLAMVDSAVGGKTGVNLAGKNLVGAFHQPSGVIADLRALETLPARELRSGLGEVWKTAVLAGSPLFERLEATADRVRARDLAALEPVVAACLRHKASVVAADEREAGARALLNLGHTLGHALEALEAGALAHGEAVSVGLAYACRLAERLGRTEPGFADRALALGRALGLPLRPPRRRTLPELRPYLEHDKKARAGRLRWVLPAAPGHCELTSDVPEDALEATLEDLQDE